ncbi:MAG: hypothetical protein KDB03_15230 [Planctomycetales bacterium]|nr:hypothetical protein [Planctomycetales bacterium]
MNSSSFAFQWTPATLCVSGLALLLVCTLSWIAWQRSGHRLAVGMLELLRIVIVVLTVFLLNQPETLQIFQPSERPQIAILVDRSVSMDTQDVGLDESNSDGLQTRKEATSRLLQEEAWSVLGQGKEISVTAFAGDKSDQTDIFAALQAARSDNPNLRAIVLASDGDWNTGQPPVDMAMRLRMEKIPIFSIPVGSQSRLPDVELLSFDAPTFGIVDKNVRIPFTVESSLPRDYVAQVEFTSTDGSKLTQQVRVGAMGRTSDAIVWKPDRVGDYTLKLDLPIHPEERILTNNQREVQIAIREEKLKVLVIESLPRWEYRYLRNALSRDPGVEVACLLFHPGLPKVGGGNRDYIQTFPEQREDLAQYDVVFLGDVGLQDGQLTEEQCRLLKGLVEQQASGLVFMPGMAGYMSTLVDSPLEPLLPVILDTTQPNGWGSRTPSHFALTELGRRSLLTKLADTQDDNMQVWENLPGFQWHAPVIRAKAGTDVLTVHEEQSNEYGRVPLLVTRTYGSGKVLFMGTDGAWRWRRGVEDLYHYRFWGQVVRWMAYQRNMAKGESMRFYYSPEQPQIRQTLALSANVMEQSGEPLSRGTVTARIVAPSGQTDIVQFTSTGTEWGSFAGVYEPTESGPHQVTLRCKENNGEIQTTVFVQGASLEQPGKPSRPEVLEELSRVTRGKVLAKPEVEVIVRSISQLPEPSSTIRRLQLWSHPLLAATLIVLLGLFWVGRKMIGTI